MVHRMENTRSLLLGEIVFGLFFLASSRVQARSPELDQKLTEGRSIAKAVCAFRQQTDLWPLDFAELIDAGLIHDSPSGWQLTWASSGNWAIGSFCAGDQIALRCEHSRGKCTWKITEGVFEKLLGTERVSEDVEACSKPLDRKRQTFMRRIERERKSIIHYQGFFSWLFRNGDAACLVVSKDAVRVFPDHWWG